MRAYHFVVKRFLSKLINMKRLKFHPSLVSLVLSKEKTSTWRLFDDKNLSEGDMLELINSETGEVFAKAQIKKVSIKKLGQLSDEDRVGHEPFSSDQEMHAIYEKYYKVPVDQYTEIKIIRFITDD